jgi:hypothetical protein
LRPNGLGSEEGLPHSNISNNPLAVKPERENDVGREDFSVRAFETSVEAAAPATKEDFFK